MKILIRIHENIDFSFVSYRFKDTGKREPGEINAIPWGKLEEAAAF